MPQLLTDLQKRKISCLWDGLILLKGSPRSRKGTDGHSADRAGPQRQLLQRFRGELFLSPQGIKKQFQHCQQHFEVLAQHF